MTGTLFLVATPIGNLEDITLRALRVLREVEVIAAEDTRRTGKLLAHYGISTATLSFHEHNYRSRIPHLLERLRSGRDVGLVTDAGTPGVSDPGVELVEACIEAAVPIDPIPGASAPLAAAVASGFPITPLTILGFAPGRASDRKMWLDSMAMMPGTVTFFDAPHRIAATLAVARDVLGERPIVVARELTKVHQQFLRGTAATVAAQLGTPRGEITVVVGPAEKREIEVESITDSHIAAEFGAMTNSGECGSRGEAIAAVARKLHRSRKEVFDALERAKLAK
jgi:16S rRNA (cytidine1402-2'-O)-methyltransferase